MEQLDIFGSELYEYLFVIEPDQKTKDRLIWLRKLVDSIVPLSEEILYSKPHISICYFEARDFSDEYIITKLNQVLSSISSFDVKLDGAEYWKNGTLILKVNPDENISELQKQLSGSFKGVVKNFHMTIARNLTDQLVHTLPMENFEHKGDFKCQSISVLKKKRDRPYHLLETIFLK